MSDLSAEQKYNEARMLLDHPLLKEAFAEAREEIVQAMEELSFGPQESEVARDKLVLGLQALKAVKETIYSKIDDYRMGKTQQEEGHGDV